MIRVETVSARLLQHRSVAIRFLGMRFAAWSLLLPLACALSACDAGAAVLGLGGNNGGIVIGGTGAGTSGDTLRFSVQPSSATAGNIITPAIQVVVRDSLGNVDSSFTKAITISIATNPVGGLLSGTTSAAPVNGIAQFGDLSIDKAGTGYALRASVSGAAPASSGSFDILAP